MNIEDFLKSVIDIDKEAHAAAEAVEFLVRRAHDEDAASALANPLIDEFARDLTGMEKKTAQVADMIAALPDRDIKRIFVCRYIHKLSWADIADATNFSATHVQRLHKKGIKWLETYYTR